MATNNRSKAKSKGVSFTLSTNNKPFTPGGSFMDRMPTLPGNKLPGNGGNNKPGGSPGVSGGSTGSGGVFFGGGVSGGGSAGANDGGFSSNKPGTGGAVQNPIGKGPSGSNKPAAKPAQVEAKERAGNYSKANEAYFAEAAKRAGITEGPGGDAAWLAKDFQEKTKGLDQELAFKAMQGGRMFGESDMKRYNELLAQKNGKGGSTTNNTTDNSINDSYNTTDNSINDSYNTTDSNNTNIADSFNRDESFAVGGDLSQQIGKQGDMNTSIGDNNQFGAGSSIGNDYSVTIGGQNAGNSSRGGGLDNMMGAAAYSALNTNSFNRSQSMLNGYGRAAGATQEAEKATGARNRVGALYNLTGMDQNYWNNKAKAQQGFYLGDIFNQQAPNWVQPPNPIKPEDKTEDIADQFDP